MVESMEDRIFFHPQMLSTKEQLMGLLRLIPEGEGVCSGKPISYDKCFFFFFCHAARLAGS